MAAFYVLPSRHLLGQRFSEILTSLFPGTQYSPWDWPDLAGSVAALIEAQADAHVVYREDIDEKLSVKDALLRDFGAALDDEIIEIHFGPGLTQFMHERWATEPLRIAA
ncbi:MAG: hypothetical protein HY289_00180 [Planctomycetes bacterium]|nr:hypothetical protein [Planctomycetota bacterium]